MSFRTLEIKKEYRSLLDNVAKDFYIPLLSEAVVYKRAVGYFSSSIFANIAKGILEVVKNNGAIQIIASPNLSDEDIKAIQMGYQQREDVFKTAVLRELKEPRNGSERDCLNLLANLIADGILDIKIAVTESGGKYGIYHEKMGLFVDAAGNKVAFSGSNNETANALMYNYETLDVYRDWVDDPERVKNKENSFFAMWNNIEPNIRTFDFSDINDEFIRRYKQEDIDYQKAVLEGKLFFDIPEESTFFAIPDDVNLFNYQKEAIVKWFDQSFCGIYDMATGTGKTYTALGSLAKLSKVLGEKLAVVIVAPYQHLVEQWVEDIIKFNVNPIVAYSYPGQKWRKQFTDAINAYNVGAINNFCIIATNATFSSDDFQEILKRFKKNFCFVVDEAHNFGAEKLGSLLPVKARYRLALSATIERFRDDEGTERLTRFFGPKCISFTLKEAIQKEFLTSYYYHPVLVTLDEDELERYNDLTRSIIKCGGASKENCEKNPHVEMLLIKRARIVSGCRAKVDKLIEVMKPFKDDNYILVYCGATKYDNKSITDEDDIRQIEEVCRRLYKDLGMKVRKFTSSENKHERTEIREMFAEGEDLQVITAIKCLDEGVNIPAIKTAFILASSTNPKEYIQRRGRVLRKAKGKTHAVIFDFITLPRPLEEVQYCNAQELEYDLTLVRKEFARMLDFAETARNPFEIDDLKDQIQETYHRDSLGGYEDEYE